MQNRDKEVEYMILTAKYTNQGGRELNEDSHGIFVKNGCICAVVADGVGGHGGGDKASGLAVRGTYKLYQQSQEDLPIAEIDSWVQQINEAICRMQTDECHMRTTLCMVFTDNWSSFWAHVGDSRVYYFREDKLLQMTTDHSVSQMAVFSGEITQDQIRHHVDRNKLIRSIGNQREIKVDISEITDVSEGKHAFLLCTDGFWEYVLEEEMEATLQNSKNPVQWLEKMTGILQERVPENNDNNTAVAVWVINEKEVENDG